MITIKNVKKSYDGNVFAVNDISFEIRDGEIFGFIGPNGAGKSTTLKMMSGILAPTSGSISVNGFDIVKEPIEAKKQFAFVPDDPNSFLRLKGIEYLHFIAAIYKLSLQHANAAIQRYAEIFELTEVLGSQINSYSHGMRQKIMIIGALIRDPKCFILDEPMTGLDPASAFKLKSLMREHIKTGNSVLFSTHVLEVAEKLCTRVGIIDHGKLLFVGSLEELRQQEDPENTGKSLEEIFISLTGADVRLENTSESEL